MNYYKLTNRTTRKEQVLNSEELKTFYKKNSLRDYAISNELSPQDKIVNRFINTIAISFFSVATVILLSEIITDLL